MYIEVVERVGGQVVRLPASQVVVYMDNGTPVSLAAVAGPPGMVHVSHAKDPGFNRDLNLFGVPHTVIYNEIEDQEPPPGSKLLLGPGVDDGK